jgi:hypothetical protein
MSRESQFNILCIERGLKFLFTSILILNALFLVRIALKFEKE